MHQTPELPQRPDAGFSSLFDEHGSIIVLIDPATNQIHNANQAAAHFYGYTRAELCALRFDQLCTAGPEQLALALQRALRREQSRYVHIHRLAGGASRTVEVYMSPTTLDGQLVLFAIIHDITERMCTEEVLRQSELRYRTLLETLNVSVCCWLPDTTLLFANEQYRSIFGITGDPSGRQWLEFLPEAARAETAAFYHELATNPRTVSYEHPVTIGDGQVRHYSWIDTPIFDANRQLLEFQSVGIDITERKQAEEALRELNQTLEQRVRQRTVEVQDLYENAPVGYHSLDANGTVLMINQTQLDWLGHTRDELLGRSMASFLTPASMAAFDERFQAFKGQGSMRDLEFEMVRKDGSLIPILLSATAIYDEYGEYVMSRSTVFDNSEHKQAELALRESEEQNRLLFEESPDAVVLFRADGTLAQLNRAFEQLTGYSTAQLSGQTLASVGLVTAEKFLQLANLVTEHLKANTSFAAIELRLRLAGGELRDVATRIFGLKIRGQQHYLATMRDITTEKQVAETLRQANAELARAARAKDEFLANMSHELRTPLNAILSLSEAMEEQIYGPLSPRQYETLRRIEMGGRHLLTLINDILDLAKVEAGRLELHTEQVLIYDACQASMLFVREQALKKRLQLNMHLSDPHARIAADVKRLKQILVNLLSNAVKFTPDGGKVTLAITLDEEAGVGQFAVTDTGIGIHPEDLGRLFQPFSQLDPALNREHEGTGLGLALVRRLAELHGGSVTVESQLGEGSCFTVALPYHLLPEEAPAATDALRAPAPGTAAAVAAGEWRQRILLAEDNEANSYALGDYLRNKGYEVLIARDGHEALTQADTFQPHLILMDIQMPHMDGLEATRLLRAQNAFAATPIIALTALAMPGDKERCLAAGASEYMTKPISLKALAELLKQLLKA